jgi:multidrug efflux pump subunit AcrB
MALRWLGHAHSTPGPDWLGRRLADFFTRVLTPFLGGDAGRRNRLKLLGGIGLAILASIALVPTGLVVMKMLPFDNKSEFQVVVDLPTGTPVETTDAVLREMADELAKVPEVVNYQIYAGLAAPINFNGLVRQYYLRGGGEVGDIQVNLADRSERSRKSHEIAQSVRPALEARTRHGAEVRWSRYRPGRQCCRRSSQIYGPDA